MYAMPGRAYFLPPTYSTYLLQTYTIRESAPAITITDDYHVSKHVFFVIDYTACVAMGIKRSCIWPGQPTSTYVPRVATDAMRGLL